MDMLMYYATPPNNYVGSVIFLLYIIFALYATFSIIYSLYTQYTAITNDARQLEAEPARLRHIKIYAFLASLSFATLSANMLLFLINHYLDWTGEKHVELSTTVTGQKLKNWMLASGLFQDFASELVQNRGNASVSQIAILATWFANIWMAGKARTRGFDASRMGNFILLSQILPISFTISLFLIQLHLSSANVRTSSAKANPPNSSNETMLKTSRPITSLQLPNILLNACLLAQPSLNGHPVFISLLLLERFILLLPHAGLMSLRESDVDKSLMISAGFVVASQWMGSKNAKWGTEMQSLLNGGYAVKALGWDAVLGAVLWVCLSWGGGV